MSNQNTGASAAPEGKLYKSSLSNFLPIAIAGYIAACFLIREGILGLQMYPVEGEDPFRYISGHAHLVVAGLIFLGTTTLLIMNANRRIGITDKFFLYRRGKGKTIQLPWNKIAVQAPFVNNPGIFSRASVTDGKKTITIEKFFFPDFIEICHELKDARHAARNRSSVSETSSRGNEDLKQSLGFKKK